MSLPELKPDPKSGVFYLHWTDTTPAGERGRSRRKSTGTRSLAEAKIFLAQWVLMDSSSAAASSDSTHTIADLWDVYDKKHLQVKTASPETANHSWNNLRLYFGHLRPKEINQDAVDEYEGRRVEGKIGRPCKPSTVRRELSGLKACLSWHVSPKRREPMIKASDVPAFDLPAEGESRKVWLRSDQMARLLAAAASWPTQDKRAPRIERFLWLALETGARKTAIYELTWDRIDFEAGFIDYDVPGRRKTKKRRATVPISPNLRPQLERWYKERINDRVLDHGAEIWATVQSVARKAGFGPEQRVGTGQKPKATGISPHVLRHTAATYMLLRGVPPWTVAGILGNSEEMVRKVYGHLCDQAAKEAVAKISGVVDADAELLAAIKSGKLKVVESV